jgi:hypothetical protein
MSQISVIVFSLMGVAVMGMGCMLVILGALMFLHPFGVRP